MASLTDVNSVVNQDQIAVAISKNEWTSHVESTTTSQRCHKIEAALSAFYTALADTSNETARKSAKVLSTFMAEKMTRVTIASTSADQEDKITDSEFSLPLIQDQMKEYRGDVNKIQMWIDTAAEPKAWLDGILDALAGSGALPPKSSGEYS